jgi:AcrR family transcriptional regulator
MRNRTDLSKEILKASLALIQEGGLDRLSMREVARKAGVSHQAPYHYFVDREAILAAIAGEGFSKLGTVAHARCRSGRRGTGQGGRIHGSRLC